MALLTFEGSVVKGTAKTMTLNKSEILSMPTVSGDAYWSDSENIAHAVVMYESLGGDQSKHLLFDFTEASPTADLFISSRGRDNWKVVRVTLFDFDGASRVLPEAVLAAEVSGGISDLDLAF